MDTKALVAVSFGTTHAGALGAIEKIENRLQDEKPDFRLFRAFTSKMIIDKLAKNGTEIYSPSRLLEKLLNEGYTDVLCQPTHVIRGIEYDKLHSEAEKWAGSFKSLTIGSPLLNEKSDYDICCETILSSFSPLAADEALVLMGHGTSHFANSAYCQLENTFRAQGQERVYVGTVEGFPTIHYIMDRLKKHNIKTVRLLPFMVVAGEHALNDLAGDGGHSWNTILAAEGYKTKPCLQGLGELSGIRELFAKHLRNATEL